MGTLSKGSFYGIIPIKQSFGNFSLRYVALLNLIFSEPRKICERDRKNHERNRP